MFNRLTNRCLWRFRVLRCALVAFIEVICRRSGLSLGDFFVLAIGLRLSIVKFSAGVVKVSFCWFRDARKKFVWSLFTLKS